MNTFPINDLKVLASLGSYNNYYGKNERGNELIQYAISKMETIEGEMLRGLSVQNTKNGNYRQAIELLEAAMKLDPEDVSRYYGWLLLYYYRDYEKALQILEIYDAYTPEFSDAPMGEDIHYLKGLAHFQLHHYDIAINEFDAYINNMAGKEEYVNVYTFVQKGRSLAKLKKYQEAMQAFDKAIFYFESCTEAYYFKALTQLEIGENENACKNLKKAKDLISQGNKSSDNYVEYFHEIYPEEIDEAMEKNCR